MDMLYASKGFLGPTLSKWQVSPALNGHRPIVDGKLAYLPPPAPAMIKVAMVPIEKNEANTKQLNWRSMAQ